VLIGQAHKSALTRNYGCSRWANIRDDGWRLSPITSAPHDTGRRQLPSSSGSSNVEPAAATPSPNGIGTAGLLSETGRLRAPSLAHTKPARRTAVASPLAAGWRERNRRPEAGYASAGSGRWLENPLPGTAPVAAPLMA